MPTDLEQERELLRAERDAEICGIGYLVDGVRVSPERVRVFYRDRAALAAPAAPIPMHAICEACGRDYGDHDLTRCPTGIESHFRAAAPQALPERDQSRSAERQGLFRKFDVRRVDGSDAHGGKHHGCRYFVLDMDHDAHAGAALAAYAAACESTHPDLARDLREKWGTAPQEQPNMRECRHCGFLCAPNPNESGEWKPLAAPQEPPNDEDLRRVWTEVCEDALRLKQGFTEGTRRALRTIFNLGRYGAAPQGGRMRR